MFELYVEMTSIPVEGREFLFSEPRIWTDPIFEFHLPCRLGKPFEATLEVHPHKGGFMLCGNIRGSVTMPCARCIEDVTYIMDERFDEFEPIPAPVSAEHEEGWLHYKDGVLFLDVSGFLWEQFQLALPAKVLCSPMCRGLCSICGANNNQTPCHCVSQKGDSRWDVLRSLHSH